MSQNEDVKWLHDFMPYIEEVFAGKKEDVGLEHSIRTMNIARYLATLEHADRDMASLLGLLSRFTPAEVEGVLPLIDKPEEFKTAFMKNFNDLIVNNKMTNHEIMIAHDADCLESMGAIGIVRHFYRGAAERLSLKLLIKNFADKIARLQASIQTESGKNMATERQNFISTFLNRLKGETVWENF